MSESSKDRAEKLDAARQRKDYVRALEEERAGLVVQGKEDRIAAVDAEIARLKKPNARRTPVKSDG